MCSINKYSYVCIRSSLLTVQSFYFNFFPNILIIQKNVMEDLENVCSFVNSCFLKSESIVS